MQQPQDFLHNISVNDAHLQFTFKANMDAKAFLKTLGHLWNSNILGVDDLTLNKHHEYGGSTGYIVVGFRPEFWAAHTDGNIPQNLSSFNENIIGINGKIAPAEQLDLWVWVSQINVSALLDTTLKIKILLKPYADLTSAQSCFIYHNSITLDGFADGVGNPNIFRAADVTIIPDGEKGAGGTTVLVQKWIVEVETMRGLKVSEAEKVYGRNKAGSHLLSPVPETSHYSRNQYYDAEGKTIDIVRRNAYFGNAEETGVVFVGFSNNIDVTLGMLKQMYGVGPDKKTLTDKLIDYATAKSSAIYFVPSKTDLMALGVSPTDQA